MQDTTVQGETATEGGPHCIALARCRRLPSFASDAGVAAVEFAILLPVLLAILLGMIDYGYYFLLNSTVVNAAREGARAGIVQSSASSAESAATTVATNYLSAAGISVGNSCMNCARVTAALGATNLVVTVTIDPFTPLTGFLPSSALPARARHVSTMRWELASP